MILIEIDKFDVFGLFAPHPVPAQPATGWILEGWWCIK